MTHYLFESELTQSVPGSPISTLLCAFCISSVNKNSKGT
jgi:hypothetical protein